MKRFGLLWRFAIQRIPQVIALSAVASCVEAQQSAPTSTRLLNVQLQRGGLLPASTSIPAGSYCIKISNAWVRADLTFRLEDSHGKAIAQKLLAKRFSSTELCAPMPPDKYRLFVAENPDWAATFDVEAR